MCSASALDSAGRSRLNLFLALPNGAIPDTRYAFIGSATCSVGLKFPSRYFSKDIERLTNIEGVCGVMRPAIMCLLILAAPMVSGITLPLPATDSEVEDLGEEVELVLSNGYWTQDLWINVQDMGLEPLRVVDERTLLVWKTSPVKEYDWFEVQRVDNGEWRGEGAYAENSHTRVKILLEPRLPKIAQLQVINNLRQLGIAVQYEVNDFQSPISSNFNVNLSDGFDLSEILSLDGI